MKCGDVFEGWPCFDILAFQLLNANFLLVPKNIPIPTPTKIHIVITYFAWQLTMGLGLVQSLLNSSNQDVIPFTWIIGLALIIIFSLAYVRDPFKGIPGPFFGQMDCLVERILLTKRQYAPEHDGYAQ